MPQTQRVTIRPFNLGAHLSQVTALEQAAGRDPDRLYEGTPWQMRDIVKHLNLGRGFVALVSGRVVGAALFRPVNGVLVVDKLLAGDPHVENCLVGAVRAVAVHLNLFLRLPIILEL